METEKKYCSKCQHERKIEHFEEGFKTCNTCRAKSRRHYHNHKDDYDEYKKEWRHNNPEKVKEQRERHKEKYQDKTFYCELCDVEGTLKCKAQHEKSQFHQAQLKRHENPDMPPLPEPDEIKMISGIKHHVCKKCKMTIIYYRWENHIMERHQPEVENV